MERWLGDGGWELGGLGKWGMGGSKQNSHPHYNLKVRALKFSTKILLGFKGSGFLLPTPIFPPSLCEE